MVNIDFHIKTKYKFHFNKAEIEKAVEESLEKLDKKGDFELEMIFCGKTEIQGLNTKFRKIKEPTDVLSFPQTQFKPVRVNILGSIAICPEIAGERGEDVLELVRHGLLHLLGYDHEIDLRGWDKAVKIIDNYL